MRKDNRDLSAEELTRKEAKSSKKILTEDVKLYGGETASSADIGAVGAAQEALRAVYVFPELFAGDCMMQYGATLVLNPNGTGTFTARVRSTDDDDEWKMHFVIRNPGGDPIVYLPARIQIFGTWIHPFWVKELPQPEHGYYDWHIDFAYDASFYPQLASLIYEYSC